MADATPAPPQPQGWRRRFIDVYLAGWMIGAATSALGLLTRGDDLAASSQWSPSSWQREIGLWNIVVIALIVQALAANSRPTKLALARAGIVASLLLGGNHLSTLLASTGGPVRLHATALIGNSLNLTAALAVLAFERQPRTKLEAVSVVRPRRTTA